MVLGSFFYFIFYTHFVSMVLLCPDTMAFYGFGGGISHIGWAHYLKWLAAAYPASLIYGVLCADAWRHFRCWRGRDKRAD